MQDPLPDRSPRDPYASYASRDFSGVQDQDPWAEPRRDFGETPNVNPYVAAWTAPRSAIRVVVAQKPEWLLVLFVMVAGVSESLGRASQRDMGLDHSLGSILLIAAVVGPFGGLLSWYVGSWLIGVHRAVAGRRGLRERTCATRPAGRPPSAASSRCSGSRSSGWFGHEMFLPEMPSLYGQNGLLAVFLGFAIIEIVLGVWILVSALNMIGQVHGFSAWRALGACLMAMLIVLLPLVLLAMWIAYLR